MRTWSALLKTFLSKFCFFNVSGCLHFFCYSAENFMTGYRIVFDREKLMLGWKKTDCKYWLHKVWRNIIHLSCALSCIKFTTWSFDPHVGLDIEESSFSQLKPRNSNMVPPAVAGGLGNHSTPKSEEDTISRAKNSAASPRHGRYTSDLTSICLRFLLSFFLLL